MLVIASMPVSTTGQEQGGLSGPKVKSPPDRPACSRKAGLLDRMQGRGGGCGPTTSVPPREESFDKPAYGKDRAIPVNGNTPHHHAKPAVPQPLLGVGRLHGLGFGIGGQGSRPAISISRRVSLIR